MKLHLGCIGFLALLCCFWGGCTEKAKQDAVIVNPEKEFIEALTQKDTADFIGLTKQCMDTIQGGNIDAALNLIYCIQNDTLMPLTPEMKVGLKNHFKRFPVKDYELISFEINGYYTNSVKYNIRFKEETEVPNSIKFTFNPIWLGDAWYLTLKNN